MTPETSDQVDDLCRVMWNDAQHWSRNADYALETGDGMRMTIPQAEVDTRRDADRRRMQDFLRYKPQTNDTSADALRACREDLMSQVKLSNEHMTYALACRRLQTEAEEKLALLSDEVDCHDAEIQDWEEQHRQTALKMDALAVKLLLISAAWDEYSGPLGTDDPEVGAETITLRYEALRQAIRSPLP